MSLGKIYFNLHKLWDRHSKLIAMILVFIASLTAFWLRSQQYFNVVRSVGVIHPEAKLDELDPFINYWTVSYMDKNGFLSYFSLTHENPATCLFWYPECRNIYGSELPGHIFTIYFLYQLVKPLNISLYDLMAFIPPLLGALGTIFTALVIKEVTKSNTASILSAFMYALMFFSREVAGFTVKYSFGLFTAPLALWLHIRLMKKPSIVNAVIAGCALAYASSVWTGIGLTAIPIYSTLVLAPLVLDLDKIKNFKKYTTVFLIEIAIPIIVMRLIPPYGGGRAVIWILFLITFMVYLIGSSLCIFLGRKRGVKVYTVLITLLTISGIVILYLMSVSPVIRQTITSLIPMAGKIMLGLGINPGGLAETVAQYQPGYLRPWAWHTIILLLVLVFVVFPMAVYDLIKHKSIVLLTLALWSFLAWYATYNTAYFDDYAKISLAVVVGIAVGRLLAIATPSIRTIGRMVKVNLSFEKIIVLLFAIFIAVPSIYNAYSYSNIYSYKYTMLAIAEGFYSPTDVWIKALDFIRKNTSIDSLVVSWWDYGYWLSVIGNRSTLADGATINADKIHRLAQFFTFNYSETYTYLKEFGSCKKSDVYVVIFSPVDVYVLPEAQTIYMAFPLDPEGFGDIPKFIMAIVYLATGNRAIEDLRYAGTVYQLNLYTNKWIMYSEWVPQGVGITAARGGGTKAFTSLNIGSRTLLNATLPRLFMWSVGEKLKEIYPNFSITIVPTILGYDERGRIVIFMDPTIFGYTLEPEVLHQEIYDIAYVSMSQPIEVATNVYRYVFVSILKLKNDILKTVCS